MSRSERIYLKGYEKFEKEMNIINILRTIKKLKAGISVVINNDRKLISKAYEMFIKHSVQTLDAWEGK
jgi:hypothetical protein